MRITILALLFCSLAAFTVPDNTATEPGIPDDINALLVKNTCATCHKLNEKLVGPSWKDIAAKKYKKSKIVSLVYKPVPSNWPLYPPMAALPNVPKSEAGKIAGWLVTLK